MKFAYRLAHGGLLFCALVSCAAAAGTTCNKQPVPPQSVQAIGRDMIVNGVPTSIVGVQFAGAPDDVSKQFRTFWVEERVPTKSQREPSGLLLSALDEHCLYTLSIPSQPDGSRTRALMSIIRLGGDPVRHQVPDSAVLLPESGKTVSDVESRDPSQTGRTWIIELSGDARWNAQRYRNLLTQQGWSAIGRQPTYQSGIGQSTRGTAFSMQHGNDSLDASFSNRNGNAVAVINVTRNR